MQGSRLPREFYTRDVLEVAPDLLGKTLVRARPDGTRENYIITETEAYRGKEDLACHASKGRTTRTEIMYHNGGQVYMYLIYGMHWMLNIVTSIENEPQAVLIRGLQGLDGPGKLTRKLDMDRSFYGIDLVDSELLWIEDSDEKPVVETTPRIGIDYAGEKWRDMEWRFFYS